MESIGFFGRAIDTRCSVFYTNGTAGGPDTTEEPCVTPRAHFDRVRVLEPCAKHTRAHRNAHSELLEVAVKEADTFRTRVAARDMRLGSHRTNSGTS
jgi:hypothetical protein